MDIVIRQNGKRCDVLHGDTVVFSGGRIAAKQRAVQLHTETGEPVWNWKAGGKKVQVHYKSQQRKPGEPLCFLCMDYLSAGDAGAHLLGQQVHTDCYASRMDE